MGTLLSRWPYAALATIEYVFVAPRVELYVVFPYPMNQDFIPDHAVWSCWVDGVIKPVLWSAWNDAYVLRLSAGVVAVQPSRVVLKYMGPDKLLLTTWGKIWEPWGYLPCHRYTELISKTITAGMLQTPIVAGVKVLFLDCSGGNVGCRSFGQGVNSQVLHVARLDDAANNAIMMHKGAPPGQPLNMHKGATETLNGEYGGWIFACDGSEWYDVSHAKHV